MKTKPPCTTILPWLKANLGPRCTAPLTGTDVCALFAAVQIIELYCIHTEQSVLDAYALVVQQMQPGTRELAYHAIAHVMDWSHRADLWLRAGLSPFNPRRCAHE